MPASAHAVPDQICSYPVRPATVDDVWAFPAIEKSAGLLFGSCEDPNIRLLVDDEPVHPDVHLESIREWNSYHVGVVGTWVAAIPPLPGKAKGEEIFTSKEVIVGFIKTRLVRVMDNGHEHPDNLSLPHEEERYFIHIDELSVHSDHQRRGLASKLVDVVKNTAWYLHTQPSMRDATGPTSNERSSVHVIGVTLITMQNVPFNRPFYEKFGFRCSETCPATAEIRSLFGKYGLQLWLEDAEEFARRGLAEQRCWMQYLCSS